MHYTYVNIYRMLNYLQSNERSFARADETVNDTDLEPDVVGSGTSNVAVAKESDTDSVVSVEL